MGRLTGKELRRRYSAGERNFSGADLRELSLVGENLSGIDLSEADIRGTHLDRSILIGAKLNLVRTGRSSFWIAARAVSHLLLGGLAAFLTAWSADILAYLFSPKGMSFCGAAPGILVIVFCTLFLALAIPLGIVRAIVSVGVAAIVLAIGTTAALAGTSVGQNPKLIAMVTAGAVAGTGIIGVAIVLGGLLTSGATFVGILAGALLLTDPTTGIVTKGMVAAGLTAVVGISVYSRRRATVDGKRDQLVRHLIVVWECLGSTSFRGANLTGADLTSARLQIADFRGARLVRTEFCGARIGLARFDQGPISTPHVQRLLISRDGMGQRYEGMDLRGVSLRRANLAGASLLGAHLQDADLESANLQRANLNAADLRGACLKDADLGNADLTGTRIDVLTYVQSSWTADTLASLSRRGVEIIALETFPENARGEVLGTKNGLSLWFGKRLGVFERFLVDGLIVGVLGPESECRVVEYSETTDGAIVRIVAPSRTQLESLAEALYRRIWEQSGSPDGSSLHFAKLLNVEVLREGLGQLREHLERMELHLADESSSLARADQVSSPALAKLHFSWRLASAEGIQAARGLRLLILHAANAQDEQLRKELEGHMSGLVTQRFLLPWHVGLIEPGSDRSATIQRHVDEADVALVLVSSDLLRALVGGRHLPEGDNPLECMLADALTRAQERQAQGKLRLIPILLRPVDYTSTPFSRIKPLPELGRPITSWGEDRDSAWLEVVSSLRRTLLNMT